MKKLLLFSAFISFAFFADAQSTDSATYKAFKVDLDLGYAIPSSGSGTKAGVTFSIEPHYRLCDAFAIGFRFEGAALGYKNTEEDDTKIKVSLLTSYCLTGDYYLMNGGFRPFIGAGLGEFSLKVVASNEDISGSASSGKFGYFPRVGFEASHFRFSAAYDVLGNNSNYAAFTIGVFLGGGKK